MARLSSMVCKTSDFYSEWYGRREHQLHHGAPLLRWKKPSLWRQLRENFKPPKLHRKMWEWAAIVEVLHQRDMLREGRSALGFAVGTEPLPAYFASHGVKVLATDLDTSETDSNWSNTGQQSTSLDQIWYERFIDKPTFESRVTFRQADMTRLNELPTMQVDFLWSSCSLEHLGSLEAGLVFVERAMSFLKPGGLAVHTTEYNVKSNDETLDSGWAVIYRKRDLETLPRRLKRVGAVLEPINYHSGWRLPDFQPDKPPYDGPQPHVKLLLDGHVATSALLVIRKEA